MRCKNCGKEIVNGLVFGWIHTAKDGHLYSKNVYCSSMSNEYSKKKAEPEIIQITDKERAKVIKIKLEDIQDCNGQEMVLVACRIPQYCKDYIKKHKINLRLLVTEAIKELQLNDKKQR